MSNLNRAGIIVNFPGLAAGNSPQDVVMFFDDFLGSQISDTADAAVWLATVVAQAATADTIVDMSDNDMDEAGGILQLTTEATANDGENMQVNGEAFHIKAGYPMYFETRVACQDVSDLDFFIGLSAVDAEIMSTGLADGIGFELETGVMSAITAEGSTEELTTITAMVDKALSTPGGWHRLAFFYDGIDTITFYQDSNDDGQFTQVATRTVSTSTHDVPQTVGMTPTIEAINGDTAAADVFWCDYVLCAQARYKAVTVG